MKILVVDDNAINRKFLRVLLVEEGHAVIEAEDGRDALRLLDRESIDAVISDILMPHLDGYRLCYEIRRRPEWNPIPFIAYTAAYSSSEDEQVALDFGADKFIAKPALPEVIISALHESIGKRGGRSKQFRVPDELSAMKEYSEALIRKLENTNEELSKANRALHERAALAEFNSEIGAALNRSEGLPVILQLCTEVMVRHLDAAFARIWTYNPSGNVLELRASAGMYTHINGGHARVPVGQFKIGLIASERKPHLTNSVVGDPRVGDQEWAKREGMVSFAGYPLLLGDRLLGVMAMFAKMPLSENTLHAMASVANGIALGIERKTMEDELRQGEERFRELAENIREIFFVSGPDGTPVYYVSPGFDEITGRSRQSFETNPRFWIELIHPDDRARVRQAHHAAPEKLDSEHRIVRPDGSIRWLHARSFPVRDANGQTVRIVGIAEDITARKRAEDAERRNLERIQALHEIDLAITSTLDLHTRLHVLLEKIELFVPIARASSVRLFDRNSGRLESLACRGMDERKWRSQAPTSLRGRAQAVVTTRAPVLVRDIGTDPRTYERDVFQGLVSYVGVPLLAHEEVLGVLSLYTGHEHEFAQEEIDFIATLAGQAAVAIQNAKLYEETKSQHMTLVEQERIQRVLKELSQNISTMGVDDLVAKLTATIRDVLKVDMSDVRFVAGNKWMDVMISSGDDEIQRLPERGDTRVGATEWVVKNRKPIAIHDYLEQTQFIPGRITSMFGVRGYLATPLMSRSGEVIGVIRALCKKPRTFTAQEIDLFEQLANGAAVAIENERLYRDLETSNKVKSEFLSVMSHELKTPLNVILGYSTLGQTNGQSGCDDDSHGWFGTIQAQANNLLGMVNSIMAATQIESKTVQVNNQSTNLEALFDRIKAAGNFPQPKNVSLVWQVDNGLPSLMTDEEKLKMVLENLISNALKFTEQGEVQVFAKSADMDEHKAVEFKVADTGIGIAHESLPFVFELFRQVDSSTTRAYEGVGLGLYIAKKYCELLGGEISVQSKLGQGSTFLVRIPIEPSR